MVEIKKYPVFGLNYSKTDYQEASDVIIENAKARKSFTVACLPVHGVIEAYRFKKFRDMANRIDMVLPDGQPIKWALNAIHKLNLKERVCGPDLTLHVLEKASGHKLKVFLYGSYENTIFKFAQFIKDNYPGIEICGIHPDRFREALESEDHFDINNINNSGANLLLVSRGCPRQEFWIESHKDKIDATMMAIGAAFDHLAKTVKRAPPWMQNIGLEWLFRLIVEPRRLWKRYLVTNSLFIFLFLRYIFIRTNHPPI